MRTVLGLAIRHPEAGYQPIFLGCVDEAETLLAEAVTVAREHGAQLIVVPPSDEQPLGGGSWVNALSIPHERRVLVAPASEALAVLAHLERINPSLWPVVVLWSPLAAEEFGGATARWVAGGLSVEVGALSGGPSEDGHGSEWSIGPHLARFVNGDVRGAAVLVAPAAAGPAISTETQIRLEALGRPEVQVVRMSQPDSSDGDGNGAPHVPAGRASLAALKAGQAALTDECGTWIKAIEARVSSGSVSGAARASRATILDATAGVPAGDSALPLTRAISKALEMGEVVVLVLTQAGANRISNASAWSPVIDQGNLLVVAPEQQRRDAAEAHRAWVLERSENWPDVSDVLIGAPTLPPDATRRLQGGGPAGFDLGETLQYLSLGRMSGSLVVFSREHLGAITILDGELSHVEVLGDVWSPESLLQARGRSGLRPDESRARYELAEERLSEIASWQDTHFVLTTETGGDGGGIAAGLSAQGVLVELARRTDERRRRPRVVNDMSQVWRRADTAGADGAPGAAARVLLEAFDGASSLAVVARKIGMLDDEAQEVAAQLLAAKRIETVGTAPDASLGFAVTLPLVARELIARGLSDEAESLLREAERTDTTSVEAMMLHAALLASRDLSAAARRYRSAITACASTAANEEVTAAWLASVLNVALVEVRGNQHDARVIWGSMRDQLNGVVAAPPTDRHAWVMAELALRAGDTASAETALGRVAATQGLAGATATPHQALLDILKALSASQPPAQD